MNSEHQVKTLKNIWDEIEKIGEGYYLLHYSDGSEISDTKRKELYFKTQKALNELLTLIKKST